jgi:hypothetical protein
MTRSERWSTGTWEAFAGQEGSFYKETKGKKVGKVADEIVVLMMIMQ